MARASQVLIGFGDRLSRAQAYGAERRKVRLEAVERRLAAAFAARLRLIRLQQANDRERAAALADRLVRAHGAVAGQRRARVSQASQLLANLGYKSVLARGFAIIRDEDGVTVRSVEAVEKTRLFSVELVDGRIDARPILEGSASGEASSGALRPRARARGKMGKDAPSQPVPSQGSLFEA
jgi:exodeoxyribonuclease VII large subunit